MKISNELRRRTSIILQVAALLAIFQLVAMTSPQTVTASGTGLTDLRDAAVTKLI